jgi:zinc/manganese transport system substrate-binding protein
MFFATESAPLIDARTKVDRSMGDVHAEGNPHLHLDPIRLKAIAVRLSERMSQIDPANAAGYRERQVRWAQSWEEAIARWRAKAAPLAGKAVVAEHTSFGYLWDWLGIRQIGDLEPKPGLPPTLGHLQEVLERARAERPIAIVQSLFQDPQAGRWLMDRSSVPLLTLPSTVTADGPTAELAGLFDHLLDQLLQAERKASGR